MCVKVRMLECECLSVAWQEEVKDRGAQMRLRGNDYQNMCAYKL